MPRPVIIPGPGRRQTERSASWVPVPDGIVFVPVQLRFYGRIVTAEFGCEGEAAAPQRTFAFWCDSKRIPLSAGYASHNKSHNPAGSEQGCQFREIDKTCSGYL